MGFIITALKIIFLLGFLILIHESGHFLVAKACKVCVNEFAIGFGKAIWTKQGKETLYVLRLIPLGGFVRMEGEEEHSDKEGSFSNVSIPKKMAIVASGGLTNIIFGLVTFFILSTVYYGKVIENSNFVSQMSYGFSNTLNYLGLTIDSLKQLFTGNIDLNQLTGPIGISGMVAETSGLFDFINLLAVVSLSLGITNLLPFPPLDGGKIIIYIIEWIRKKPLKENIELNLQSVGFAMIILLSIYVAYNDVLRILWNVWIALNVSLRIYWAGKRLAPITML